MDIQLLWLNYYLPRENAKNADHAEGSRLDHEGHDNPKGSGDQVADDEKRRHAFLLPNLPEVVLFIVRHFAFGFWVEGRERLVNTWSNLIWHWRFKSGTKIGEKQIKHVSTRS